MAQMRITAADNEKSLFAHVGDELIVSLPEIPTTGYRWQLDSSEQFLILDKDDFVLPVGAGIGAGGTRVLTFHAIATGQGRLQLALRREWEKDQPSTQNFWLSVDIRP